MANLRSPAELEANAQKLNAQYHTEITVEQWTEEFKKLSAEVWSLVCLSQELRTPIVDKDLLSMIARAVVFWDQLQKIECFDLLWLSALDTNDIATENRICSIMQVEAYRNPDALKSVLRGVNKLDPNRNYGSAMASLIRQYRK